MVSDKIILDDHKVNFNVIFDTGVCQITVKSRHALIPIHRNYIANMVVEITKIMVFILDTIREHEPGHRELKLENFDDQCKERFDGIRHFVCDRKLVSMMSVAVSGEITQNNVDVGKFHIMLAGINKVSINNKKHDAFGRICYNVPRIVSLTKDDNMVYQYSEYYLADPGNIGKKIEYIPVPENLPVARPYLNISEL